MINKINRLNNKNKILFSRDRLRTPVNVWGDSIGAGNKNFSMCFNHSLND